jgi:uncharacterized protein YoaH (UPF0181 family)
VTVTVRDHLRAQVTIALRNGVSVGEVLAIVAQAVATAEAEDAARLAAAEVDDEPEPEPCPTCGACGADESCVEYDGLGRQVLVDDHGDRG